MDSVHSYNNIIIEVQHVGWGTGAQESCRNNIIVLHIYAWVNQTKLHIAYSYNQLLYLIYELNYYECGFNNLINPGKSYNYNIIMQSHVQALCSW